MNLKTRCPSPPTSWRKLGKHLHQDFLIEYPDFYSGISKLIMELSPSQSAEIERFLSKTLSSEAPGGCARRAWSELDAEFMPSDPKIVLIELLRMFPQQA